MPDYLIFQLTAALGAMGEFAGHERRGSLIWPGRAALIGLMGAALGVRRGGDFSALDALQTAVAVFDHGGPLRDYHTVETVPTAAARRPQSRPEALRLANGRTNTTITLRDYRTGPLYGVAVWGGPLLELQAALKQPVFTLYLGRKSCPLAAPLDPLVTDAASPEAALAHLRLPPWQRGKVARIMATDDRPDASRRETRHDIVNDRLLWHFSEREVAVVPVEIAPEVAK
ncbi:type I-E CRISPR-associated protein Cas5/CasD [Tropicimonas sp. IMCC34043]|uniref:type I-E CRISPR-associated protein Cas5/CasD n=1 Tax=Tropicimonas sp. IMCC34043 TaxID=2248760 RepID=UPI001300596D|nr:type I-E CRISPR-associated protein Cas5/CasD [Tropicimonas sp. IMCC34043]